MSDVDVFIPAYTYVEITYQSGLNDKDAIIVRASSLSGCPMQANEVSNGVPFSDRTKGYFLQGTALHYFREKLSTPDFSLEREKRFWIKHPTEKLFITGKMDHILMDECGPYLLDFKGVERGAFYMKLKDGIPDNYMRQLNIYKYIYYVINGVDLRTGCIQFVNRANRREHIQISQDLASLEDCEAIVMNHPFILFKLGKISEERFMQKVKEYSDEFPVFCKDKYCSFSCPCKM